MGQRAVDQPVHRCGNRRAGSAVDRVDGRRAFPDITGETILLILGAGAAAAVAIAGVMLLFGTGSAATRRTRMPEHCSVIYEATNAF